MQYYLRGVRKEQKEDINAVKVFKLKNTPEVLFKLLFPSLDYPKQPHPKTALCCFVPVIYCKNSF